MSIEKLTSVKSDSFAIKLKEFLSDADLVEVSIKDSSGQNIVGKLIEIIYDDRTGSTWITIKRPYESEVCRLKLEREESIIAHKTRAFKVW
jgi:hypothetical protein